ncbi:hypothetical protein EXIGLDRAFT_780360 [Exidia glandulosa HHB12029]|uniref:Uncharacterized protein n=1 Tax=Exidia glandulosa HHB12029 TaxID=1314781 RepID=A0A165BMS6_EXIGL|nr:hypothetical protein EXIGLDRAFT_780360 [Exidia glandulosa HHB12029]
MKSNTGVVSASSFEAVDSGRKTRHVSVPDTATGTGDSAEDTARHPTPITTRHRTRIITRTRKATYTVYSSYSYEARELDPGSASNPVADLVTCTDSDSATYNALHSALAPDFIESLNRALRTDFVSAISYSRQGQLVLHVKTPHSANQLLSKGDLIHSTIQKLFGLNATPRPKLETGDAWSKFVVHGVPIPSP